MIVQVTLATKVHLVILREDIDGGVALHEVIAGMVEGHDAGLLGRVVGVGYIVLIVVTGEHIRDLLVVMPVGSLTLLVAHGVDLGYAWYVVIVICRIQAVVTKHVFIVDEQAVIELAIIIEGLMLPFTSREVVHSIHL